MRLRTRMKRIMRVGIFLFGWLLAGCGGFSTKVLPELFLPQKSYAPDWDHWQMMEKSGFQISQLTPERTSYAWKIFTSPLVKVDLQKKVLQTKIVAPTFVDSQGHNLLAMVLHNPSPYALPLAQMLLSSGEKNFYLSGSFRSPLLEAMENPVSLVRNQLLSFLIQKGLSLTQRDRVSGHIPVLDFFARYEGGDTVLLLKALQTVNPNMKDGEGLGPWDYLFQNPSPILSQVATLWLKDERFHRLLLSDGNRHTPALFRLVSNTRAKKVFDVVKKIHPFYVQHYRDPRWMGRLLLALLGNTGMSLGRLFANFFPAPVDLSVLDQEGRNSFLLALQNPSPNILPILKYLFSLHVDMSKVDHHHRGYLGYVLSNTGSLLSLILPLLERQGLSLNITDERGYNALSYAVQNTGAFAVDILQSLLSRGLDVFPPDPGGKTPLDRLFDNNSPQAVPMLRTLIYSAYQGHANERYSRDVIFSAAASRSPYAGKMLLTILQQGFDPYARNEKRENAFFVAVRNEGPSTLDIVKLLLIKGVPTELLNASGHNIFYYAVQNPVYRFPLIDFLLSHHVALDQEGVSQTALDEVVHWNKMDQKRFRYLLAFHHLEWKGKSIVPIEKSVKEGRLP